MSTEVQKIDYATALSIPNQMVELSIQMDSIVQAVSQSNQTKGFTKALIQAAAIKQLTEVITDEFVEYFMGLQNTKLGFNTDKIYNKETVKKCIIEATLNGLDCVGNQFNIIASNLYVTKEGYEHLILQIPNLESKEYEYGFPVITDGSPTASVVVTIKWKMQGEQEQEKTLNIPIKRQNGMGADAILGKAERKAGNWLYKKLTGIILRDGDIASATEDVEFEEVKEDNEQEKKQPETKNETEVKETVKEQKDAELTEKEKKLVEFLNASKTIESLNQRWANTLKQFPDFNVEIYNEKLKQLSNVNKL